MSKGDLATEGVLYYNTRKIARALQRDTLLKYYHDGESQAKKFTDDFTSSQCLVDVDALLSPCGLIGARLSDYDLSCP
jgi:hypothetical protein